MVDLPLLIFALLFTVFSFATVGALVANRKHRSPEEGLFLGLFLGPIGIAIEYYLPDWKRPTVDEGAWHSFRSVVTYQSDSTSGTSSEHLVVPETSAEDRQGPAATECLA